MSFYSKTPRDASSFQVFSDAMLQDDSLPLSDVIDAHVFQEAFDRFDVDFGCEEDAVYTPALVLWALVSQGLFKEEQRSCNAAVSRIAMWWASQGRVVNEANQEEYPQNPSQEEGLGFPILRCVSLISLATGMLAELAIAPYCGKQTGETALLRQMIGTLRRGDILIADCYYCTYWLLAMCKARGVEVVMKNHHKRDDHPEDAQRICKGQRKVVWTKPQRPTWMSTEEYASIPGEITIRLVDVTVKEPGFRGDGFTVATTLLDHRVYTSQWIGSAYQSRWWVELDIRSIKCSLGMEILRAKTPAMVRTELWSCLLAYNLTRLKMMQSGIDGSRDVRSMSFTRCMVLLGNSWLLGGARGANAAMIEVGQNQPLGEVVGH